MRESGYEVHVLTVDEVAARLRLSPRTIQKLAARGDLPGAGKIGGTYRFDAAKIYALFDDSVSAPRKSIANRATMKRPDVVPAADRLLLGENESAQLLGVSRFIFRKWVTAGLITPVVLPFNIRRNLYKRADVLAFVDSLAKDTQVATTKDEAS